MIKKITTLALAITLLLGHFIPVFALETEQEQAIQHLIDEARRISRTEGIAVSVVIGDETHFFASGFANRETETLANEDTLWELASVSKAFTALGVLYLEDQGLLSLEDSIADHLPWLTFQYNGQPVDMQNVRLYHFMHHTSGLPLVTESAQGTLQSGVEALIDTELAFFPGEQFMYGNGNYNILGLVIEIVSGQSYESFMEEHIFRPLGMVQTFAYRDNAVATGRLAQGYATQFILFTVTRTAPTSQIKENVPTGYIISSTRDMARWLGIQLGLVTDIPEIFHTIIPRSHESGRSVAIPEHNPLPAGSYYGAGWGIHIDGHLEHGGDSPSFTTFAMFLPEEQVGITVLTNSCQTINASSIANSISKILAGNLDVSYQMGQIQIMDIVYTSMTILFFVIAIILFIFGLRRKNQVEHQPRTKKRLILIAIWLLITLALIIFAVTFPQMMMGTNWSFLLSIVSISFLTAPLALVLLSMSITWFVTFPRYKKNV